MKRIKPIRILLGLAIGLVACTEQRPKTKDPNAIIRSQALESLDGKTFEVRTRGVIAESAQRSANANIDVNVSEVDESELSTSRDRTTEVSIADMNDMAEVYNIVEYDTDADLALSDKIVFYGRPDQVGIYEFMYKVYNRRLVVLKVAHRRDLPWHEIPLAMEEFEDGRIGVPMLEYPITLIKTQRQKNADLERTNLILEVPVQTKNRANALIFDKTSFVLPEQLQLNEVFPVSFFDFVDTDRPGHGEAADAEEWYYLETVIENSGPGEGHVGHISSMDHSYRPVSHVYFRRSENGDGIEVRNAVSAEEYDDDAADRGVIDNSLVLTMGAEFFDLRLRPDGEEASSSPEKVQIGAVKDREFVQLKLAEVSSKRYPAGPAGFTKEITGVQIEDGYFSFTVSVFGDYVVGFNPWRGRTYKRELRSKMRYSFYKKSQRAKDQRAKGCTGEYEEKIAYTSDFEKFGMFTVREPFLGGFQINNRPDAEKQYKVQRHNPKCPIVYHPTSNTKRKLLPQARMMVDRWGEALRKSGSDLTIRFDPRPVPVGDVRYHTVAITDEDISARFLGVAQTVGDAKTGEVIYTQAQTSAATSKRMARRRLLRYLRKELDISISGFSLEGTHGIDSEFSFEQMEKLDLMDHLRVNPHMKTVLFDPDAQVTDFVRGEFDVVNIVRDDETVETYKTNPAFIYLSRNSLLEEFEMTELPEVGEHVDDSHYGGVLSRHQCKDVDSAEQMSVGRLVEYIEKFCKVGNEEESIESLEAYVQTVKAELEAMQGQFQFGEKITDPGVEIVLDSRIINQCAVNMVEGAVIDGEFVPSDLMVDTGLHEVGHTLALRHNFAGSSDKANHYKEGELACISREVGTDIPLLPEGVYPYPASTVMDYLPDNEGMTLFPGKYDVAALRFIYEDKVQVGDCSFVDLEQVEDRDNPGKMINLPLEQQAAVTSARDFGFCSDEQGHYFAEAMCRPWDLGTTASEVVAFYKDTFVESLKASRLRYDGFRARRSGPLYRILFPLVRIYEEWRYEVARHTPDSNDYLQEFETTEEYEAHLDDIASRVPGFAEFKDQYYEASKEAFDFMLNTVALMPNRYCVFRDPTGEKSKIVELSKIRRASATGDKVVSCKSNPVQTYVRHRPDEFAGMTLVDDVGYELWDSYYEKSIFNYSSYGFNYSVLPPGIDVAGTILARIHGFIALTGRFGLHPYGRAERFYPSMMDEPIFKEKMQEAVLNRLMYGVKIPGDPQDRYYSTFLDEKILIEEGYLLFRRGLDTPGFGGASSTRQMPYDVFITSSDPSRFALASYRFGSRFYLAAMNHEAKVSRALLSQITLIDQLKAGEDEDETFAPLSEADVQTIEHAIDVATEEIAANPRAQLKAFHVNEFADTLAAMQNNPFDNLSNLIDIAFKSELILSDIAKRARLDDNESFRQFEDQSILQERIKAFTREDLRERLHLALKIYNRTLANYEQDPSEVSAQKELIINALIRRSFYIGND
jgi:hypothetical protein